MPFPGFDQDNPQRVSAALSTAGFAQDVVLATSRVLHGQDLTARDEQALDGCRTLMRWMTSTEPSGVVRQHSERQLSSANTAALLRQASAAQADTSGVLRRMLDALDRVLDKKNTESTTDEIRILRDMFLYVGEVNLSGMTQRQPYEEGVDDCPTLIASSRS